MLTSFHASLFYCWRIAWADVLVIFEDSCTASVINWKNMHRHTDKNTQNQTHADGTASFPTLNFLPLENWSRPASRSLSFCEAPNPMSLCVAPSVQNHKVFYLFPAVDEHWMEREWTREVRISHLIRTLVHWHTFLTTITDPKRSLQRERLLELSGVMLHEMIKGPVVWTNYLNQIIAENS